MNETGITWNEIWTVVVAFLVLSGTGWGIWWKIDAKTKERTDEAKSAANSASVQALAAREEIASHKLHVAEHYATKQGVTEQLNGLTKAVMDVGDRMDKRLDTMTDRLDRVIEANHKPVRRQSSS